MPQVDTGAMLSLLTLIERDARAARELFVTANVIRSQAGANQIVAGRFANGGLVASGPNPAQLQQQAQALDAQASNAIRNVLGNAGQLQAILTGGGAEPDVPSALEE